VSKQRYPWKSVFICGLICSILLRFEEFIINGDLIKMSCDILFFVEDPGAANYIAQLPPALLKQNIQTRVLAAGSAAKYFSDQKIPYELLSPDSNTALLEEISPKIIVVGTSENPNTLGLQLIKEAQRNKIQSVGFIDACVNAPYRFCGNTKEPLAFAPDWLLVPDFSSRDVFNGLGFSGDRIIVAGHPHFDYVASVERNLLNEGRVAVRRRMLPNVPKDAAVIMFAAEISSGPNPIQYQRSPEYTLFGRGHSSGRTEIVMEEFLDAAHSMKVESKIVLRLHPKNTFAEFENYRNEVDVISQGGSALEWIYASDLVVGMTSMLLQEAVILKRPVLSVLPREVEKSWLPLIQSGYIPCVNTRDELRERLEQVLRSQSRSPDDIFQFGAVDRVAAFLQKRLNPKLA
jgi:hypothetical protein